jgi:hypothetical protein
MMRWHGTTIGSGFQRSACATARVAAGLPISAAMPAYEVAARQAQVERPIQTRAVAAQVLQQLAMERLDLGAVFLQLHAGDAVEPRGLQIGSAVEIFDE